MQFCRNFASVIIPRFCRKVILKAFVCRKVIPFHSTDLCIVLKEFTACFVRVWQSITFLFFFLVFLLKKAIFFIIHLLNLLCDVYSVWPCFQNQACSKLNTPLTLEPNAQKLYNFILSHFFTFSFKKRVQYQYYKNFLV